jgi:hypothetical protein
MSPGKERAAKLAARSADRMRELISKGDKGKAWPSMVEELAASFHSPDATVKERVMIASLFSRLAQNKELVQQQYDLLVKKTPAPPPPQNVVNLNVFSGMNTDERVAALLDELHGRTAPTLPVTTTPAEVSDV